MAAAPGVSGWLRLRVQTMCLELVPMYETVSTVLRGISRWTSKNHCEGYWDGMYGVVVLMATLACTVVVGRRPAGKPSRTMSAGWKRRSVGKLNSEKSGG